MPLETSEDAGQKDPASDPKWKWLQEPAIFCDAYAVDAWQSNVVRIVFGEYTAPEFLPFFRTAVVMPVEDAKQLVVSLQKAIQEYERVAQIPKTPPNKTAE